jgi:gamma-glutamylcyclotransferase (GGCT)/AIG2-like uncharacterized protein YtfP
MMAEVTGDANLPWLTQMGGRDDLDNALTHVLRARRTARSAPPRAITGSLFMALNAVVEAFRKVRVGHDSGTGDLGSVLSAIAPEDQRWLLERDSLAALAQFSPSIASNRPGSGAAPTARHDRFREALEQCTERPPDPRAILEALSDLLSAIQATIVHGATSPRDAEHASVEGDSQLVVVISPVLPDILEAILNHPSRRLACYGSLRPGERHDDVLSNLGGTWRDGGHLMGEITDWNGYPRLRWFNSGDQIPVRLFESGELDSAWDRIDSFEGSAYVRSLVPVSVGQSVVVASCYLAVS